MRTYPHMCSMDHIEIGHWDSEHEQCPLCRLIGALDAALESLDAPSTRGERRLLETIDYALSSVRIPRPPTPVPNSQAEGKV